MYRQSARSHGYDAMANGPYYYFMVGLPYHLIILDNIDQFESLVHTDAVAFVVFRWSVIG